LTPHRAIFGSQWAATTPTAKDATPTGGPMGIVVGHVSSGPHARND
jgi:hypothetical protein